MSELEIPAFVVALVGRQAIENGALREEIDALRRAVTATTSSTRIEDTTIQQPGDV